MDVLPALVGFTRALADAGLPASTHRTAAYLRAVEHVDVADPVQLYWAGRLTLCADPDDLPRYDEAFASWFTAGPPPASRGPRRRVDHVARTASLVPGEPGEGAGDTPSIRGAASETEILRARDLGELSAAERAQLRELIATLRIEPPRRASLRRRPATRGTLDPARTLRAMLERGGEPARLARRRRVPRPRRTVLLVDVSGSMSPYADPLVRFAHALLRRTPGAVEVFTLGTRLTRITRQLRARDPEHALTAAARAVPDFAGGTRLGETMRAFLDRWGQRGVARQAVVVIFSDGWERGDPALLGESMARLRRLAHAVLWVNPHAGRGGYAPVQSGIAIALPHIDKLLAGHSLSTLESLLAEIRHA
ncbi:VWA domain-containing protein [Herbihabitans rhizosphaerae]|uniref:VWA domain-containing protein n=1 Tax=Herbihabitans rhizosphaerae TaxID=1872711 RepID=UPI00102CE517